MTTDILLPRTGEVMPASHLATILANAIEEEARQAEELRALRADIADMTAALTDAAKEGPIDAGRGRKVVYDPPRRPAQRVSADGAAKHREVLLDMGGAEMVQKFSPPTISWVRANSAELVARGVPIEEVAPTPLSGPGALRVVTLEDRP